MKAIKKRVKKRAGGGTTLSKRKSKHDERSYSEDVSMKTCVDDDEEPPKLSREQLKERNKIVKLSGALAKVPKEPQFFYKRIMDYERPDFFVATSALTDEDCKILDQYIRKKTELEVNEFFTINEQFDESDRKLQHRLKVVEKYNEGRFCSIYCVQNEKVCDDETYFQSPNNLFLKISHRHTASARIRALREIRALDTIRGKKENSMSRIIRYVFQGVLLGIPFILMPPMDVNLEKMREVIKVPLKLTSIYFIAQEILLGIQEIHSKQMVHRDIKPTNVVIDPKNQYKFLIIDFGDCIGHGKVILLSPPDACTMPFLSIEGHKCALQRGPSTYKQDIESWFYVFYDMISPLPWKEYKDEKRVIETKLDFWADVDKSCFGQPETLLTIAKLVGKYDPAAKNAPYSMILEALAKGFSNSRGSSRWQGEWVSSNYQPSKK